jgi:hypothetical protein
MNTSSYLNLFRFFKQIFTIIKRGIYGKQNPINRRYIPRYGS